MAETSTNKSSLVFWILGFIFLGHLVANEIMSIEMAIQYAMEHSTTMKLAEEDRNIAQAQSTEAQSTALPVLSGMITKLRNFDIAEQIVTMDDGESISMKFGQDNQFLYGISATQILFEGRVFSAIRASKIYNKIIESSFMISTLSVEEKTRTTFYNTIVTMKVVDVIASSLNRAKSNLEKTLLLYSMGKASELDKIRSETNVAKLESEKINADKNSEIAMEYFKKTIGHPISKKIYLFGNLNLERDFEFDFEKLKHIMLKNQPAVLQATQNVQLMAENISAVRSEFIPNLSLTGAYQSFKIYDDGGFAQGNYRNNQSVSINLNLPIFNGFGPSARLRKAKAQHRKSQYNQHDLMENLQLELKNILLSLEALDKKIVSGLKELELARKGQETAMALLEIGRISQIDMEDAEITLLQSELRLLQSKLEFHTSMAALYRLVGRKDLHNVH